MAAFLEISISNAIELFLESAQQGRLTLLKKDYQGLNRPATEEGARTLLMDWAVNIGCPLDRDENQAYVNDFKAQGYLFIRDEVLELINNGVHGNTDTFSLDKPTKTDRHPGRKERNTFLIIIAALIRSSSIELVQPSKAALSIANLTEILGASVSQSTIENIIKEIPEALESRGK